MKFWKMGFLALAAASITGTVITADSAKQELTIREEGSQRVRTFKVLNPDVLQTLNSGDTVQVNQADEVGKNGR